MDYFTTYQLTTKGRQLCRGYLDSMLDGSPPMTCTKFFEDFLVKFMSRSIHNYLRVEFSLLRQGSMTEAEYEEMFHKLYSYYIMIMRIEYEWILYYMKGMTLPQCSANKSMVTTWKSFFKDC